ncbi:hypothetical protein J3R74_002945 [Puniceicoccus vermicola]
MSQVRAEATHPLWGMASALPARLRKRPLSDVRLSRKSAGGTEASIHEFHEL